MNFLLKTNDGTDRRHNFVVWSVSYVSAKTMEHKGSISSSSFYGQLVDCYYSHILALSNQWMKFSFNEMRMWGQSKITCCCICDWCKSSEKEGRGSQAMQHNFVLRIPYPLPKIAAISHKAKTILSMPKKTSTKPQLVQS